MDRDVRLTVVFYRESSSKEPVRDWLRSLDHAPKKIIGEDIKTVQWGWPLGMPLVRGLGGGLWEVRSRLHDTIARVIFCIEGAHMVLLHGFIKKSRTTPRAELALARRRAMNVTNHG